MPKIDLIQSKWMACVPIAMFLIFAFVYSTSQKLFVECDWKAIGIRCEKIDPVSALPPSRELTGVEKANLEEFRNRETLSTIYSGRFVWIFFSSMSVLFCIIALSVFGLISSAWVGRKSAICMVVLALIAGSFISYIDAAHFTVPLFENTIVSGVGGIASAVIVHQLINGLAYAATIAMVLTEGAILFQGKKEIVSSEDHKGGKMEILARRRDHLQIVLYFSTVLLIVGVLRVKSGFTWSLTFMDVDTAKIMTGLLTNAATVLGGFFTIMLASTYLPSAYVIHERAKILFRELNPNKSVGEVAAEMEKEGFKLSFTDALPRIIAVAGPLLTGPAAELLKNLAIK
jgi:hypothetical protein